MSEIQTESRKAFRELLETLGEIDRRWASDEWNLMGEADVAGAHRALMHMIGGGILTFLEADPARPRFERIVSPTRKFTGDNADAIYYDAAVSPGYAYVDGPWRAGDVVHIYFPMPVQRVLAHPSVDEDRDRAAFQRGPLVFALEGIDNGPDLARLRVPLEAEVHAAFKPDLLGGLLVLTGSGQDVDAAGPRARPFVALPYFAWANRGAAEMLVWIRH